MLCYAKAKGDVKERFFESEIVRERKKIPRGTLSRANSLWPSFSHTLSYSQHTHINIRIGKDRKGEERRSWKGKLGKARRAGGMRRVPGQGRSHVPRWRIEELQMTLIFVFVSEHVYFLADVWRWTRAQVWSRGNMSCHFIYTCDCPWSVLSNAFFSIRV